MWEKNYCMFASFSILFLFSICYQLLFVLAYTVRIGLGFQGGVCTFLKCGKQETMGCGNSRKMMRNNKWRKEFKLVDYTDRRWQKWKTPDGLSLASSILWECSGAGRHCLVALCSWAWWDKEPGTGFAVARCIYSTSFSYCCGYWLLILVTFFFFVQKGTWGLSSEVLLWFNSTL